MCGDGELSEVVEGAELIALEAELDVDASLALSEL